MAVPAGILLFVNMLVSQGLSSVSLSVTNAGKFPCCFNGNLRGKKSWIGANVIETFNT
jgi:hypothetical protein